MHSSRNLEIGTEAEAKKWFLLAGSSCLTQPAFLHKQGLNTFPGWHSPLSLRPSQNNHFIKKMPQRHAHRPIWRKQFLAWVILFFSGNSSMCGYKTSTNPKYRKQTWAKWVSCSTTEPWCQNQHGTGAKPKKLTSTSVKHTATAT